MCTSNNLSEDKQDNGNSRLINNDVKDANQKQLKKDSKLLEDLPKDVKWGYIVTQVLDTGVGIQKDKLKNIFKLFKNTDKKND